MVTSINTSVNKEIKPFLLKAKNIFINIDTRIVGREIDYKWPKNFLYTYSMNLVKLA